MGEPAWSRIRALVEEALDLDPDERARFLDERSIEEPEAVAAARDLLANESDAIAEPAIAEMAASWARDAASELHAGVRIGRYELVRLIASGGMGVVYEARQHDPTRTVALKVMRESFASPAERSRFRFEAEVLARLQHPGIAQVFESGLHVEERPGMRRETPYFALEYVEGARAITAFARERKLDLPEKLALFAQTCDAIHHGHAKGVVHRDVKPSNLLVDREGRVKVIDFGIARVSEPSFGARTLATSSGQIVGTLHYMSPEQFGLDGTVVDTRSDVYSLGVVLYELVSGAMPLVVDGKAVHEIARIVSLEAPRRLRSVDPSLPVELDWITGKALEKEPTQRYASAAELAQDVRRFLAHEPVQAGRPSYVRRVRLAVKRNKLASVVGAVAFVVLVAATAVYVRNLVDARDEIERRLYVAAVAAADASLRTNDPFAARRQLEAAPARLQRWEHRHLLSQLETFEREFRGDAETIALRPVHGTLTWVRDGMLVEHRFGDPGEPRELGPIEGNVRGIDWCSDGRRFVAALHDEGVAVYDADDRLRLVARRAFDDVAPRARFSPDGTAVVAMVEDHTLHVESADLTRELAVIPFVVQHSSISFPDAETLVATSGEDRSLEIGQALGVTTALAIRWRDGTQRVLSTDAVCRGMAGDLTLGREIVHERSGRLRLVDVRDGRTLREIQLDPGSSEAASCSDGEHVAVRFDDGTLRVFDLATNDELMRVRSPGGYFQQVRLDDASSRLVVATAHGVIAIWDISRPRGDLVVHAHFGDAVSVGFSPDSRFVHTAGIRDCTRKIWDLADGGLARVVCVGAGGGGPPEFTPAGDAYAFANDGGSTFWADSATHTVVWRTPFVPNADWRTFTSIEPATRDLLVVLGDPTRLERWHVHGTAPVRTDELGLAELRDARFDSRRERVLHVSRARFGVTRLSPVQLVWERATSLRNDVACDWISDVEIVVGDDDRLEIVDARSGATIRARRIARTASNAGVTCTAVSPDRSRLAVSTLAGSVHVFELRDLEPVASLLTDGCVVSGLAFSPDGMTLAATTAGGSLFVWRTEVSPQARSAPRLDLATRDRGRAIFEAQRSSSRTIHDAIDAIESRTDLDPLEREAALRCAHRDLASRVEVLRPAIAALAADESEPELRARAMNVAKGMRWVLRDDPDSLLAHALGALRRPALELAAQRFEKTLRALPGNDVPCGTAAQAGLAIANARLGRASEARAAYERALAGPTLEAHLLPLLEEARAAVAGSR